MNVTKVNPEVYQTISFIDNAQYSLINQVHRGMYAGWVAQNDNFFILYNSIYSDYKIINYVLGSIYDLNSVDFNSLYCILRSTLEKYADLVNIFLYGDQKYISYLQFLHEDSLFIATKDESYKNEKNKYLEIIKKDFENDLKKGSKEVFFNRKTRYDLAKGFEKSYLFEQMKKGFIPGITFTITDFNNNLSNLDSNYSQILHNNLTPFIFYNNNDSQIKASDIIKKIHCIMLVSSYIFAEKYGDYNCINSYGNNSNVKNEMYNVLINIANVISYNNLCISQQLF